MEQFVQLLQSSQDYFLPGVNVKYRGRCVYDESAGTHLPAGRNGRKFGIMGSRNARSEGVFFEVE